MIKLLIGGSPCTHWSIARTAGRETEPSGIGWELFKNYLIAKEKFKPDFFLYENNQSAARPIREKIAEELGVRLQYINSALVSAQQRKRFYAHNFGDVPLPEDRGIRLTDILLTPEKPTGARPPKMIVKEATLKGFTEIDPGSCVDLTQKNSKTRRGRRMQEKSNCVMTGNQYFQYIGTIQEPLYEIENGTVTIEGAQYPVITERDKYLLRRFTIAEAERLQTLPEGYTRAAASVSAAQKAIGNGWTAEVIIHLLSYALKGIPKDEEIVVLSMYDGIGTGRYFLEKLGYSNIRYYATEIDKHAIEIAKSNYPDIVECGDAFAVREEEWNIKQFRERVKE